MAHRSGGDAASPPGVAGVQQEQTLEPRAQRRQQPKQELKTEAKTPVTMAKGKRLRAKAVHVKTSTLQEKNRTKQKTHYYKKKDELKNKLPVERAEYERALERLVKSFLAGRSIWEIKQELLMADDSELTIAGKSRDEQARTLCRLRILHAALLEQQVVPLRQRKLKSYEQDLQDNLDELQSETDEASGATPSDQELKKKYALVVSMSLCEIEILKQNAKFETYHGCTYGWQETRIVKTDLFSWSMQKVIKCIPPDAIGQKTWEICTDPAQWAQLYSPETQMQCCRVKRVSATQMIMFQTYLDMTAGGQLRAKTLSLVSRLTTSSGVHMAIMRGLPNDRIFADGHSVSSSSGRSHESPDEVWTDLFCWIESERAAEGPPQSSLCRFSGICSALRDDASEQFWTNEIITLARNWERMVLHDSGGSGAAATDR